MKSSECAPAKHHYDHCVERVEKQQEEDGKAKEDCVEECTFSQTQSIHDTIADSSLSLPPHALRNRLCRPQALQAAPIDAHITTPSDSATKTGIDHRV